MDLILLPGNNKSNGPWIEEVAANLSDIFEKINIQYYEHWQHENGSIDIELETNRFVDKLKEIDTTDYMIFAKSAGCILTLKAIYEEKALPMACFFTGFAYSFAKKNNWDIDAWLDGYDVPTLFIEKEFDPAISYEDLKKLLEERNATNYSLQKIPGNDHHYGDVLMLHEYIQNFLADDIDIDGTIEED